MTKAALPRVSKRSSSRRTVRRRRSRDSSTAQHKAPHHRGAPGKPNLPAFSFASGVIRQPLHGEDAVCPVRPRDITWLMSPRSVVRNLSHAHDLLAEQLGRRRVINLPVYPRRRYARDNLAYSPAARLLAQIVSSWPGNFAAEYAKSLGFTADTDLADIIHAFMQDERISALAED